MLEPRLRAGWLAALIIIVAAVLLCTTLPSTYYTGADEGTYFRQGNMLLENGLADGYHAIATDYLQIPAQQAFPNPLRVGTIAVVALALQVQPGYRALSYLSMLAFLALLIGVYRFVARSGNYSLALGTLLLMASSPLGLAMARRALMDSLATATAAASLFAFCRLLEAPARWRVAVFITAMTAALLVKETAVLLLPFYAIVLVAWRCKGKLALTPWQAALAISLPPLLTIAAWLVVYGLHDGVALVGTVLEVARTPTPYTIATGRGPWFGYLVAFLILSPWVFMLAMAGMGTGLLKRLDLRATILLLLALWLLLAYAPLTKNVRYLVLLDLPLRLFAATMLLSLGQRLQPLLSLAAPGTRSRQWLASAGRWLPVVLFALLATRDVAAFLHVFLDGAVYDPVTWNLLKAYQMVPVAH